MKFSILLALPMTIERGFKSISGYFYNFYEVKTFDYKKRNRLAQTELSSILGFKERILVIQRGSHAIGCKLLMILRFN